MADVPIIALLPDGDAPQIAKLSTAALAAGADDVQVKPINSVLLLAQIRSLLRSRNLAEELSLRDTTTKALGFAEQATPLERPGRVTVVCSNKAFNTDLTERLRREMPDSVVGCHPSKVLLDMSSPPADVYVFLATGERANAKLRLMTEVRSRSQWRHAAIVLLLLEPDDQTAAMALDLGANDVVFGAENTAALAIRLRRQLLRKRQADQLRHQVRTGLKLAVTDPLTGLYNRRYAATHLARIEARSQASGRSYAVMMLDLDRFKRVNDVYGHPAGDAVLKCVAERIGANLRSADMVARVGGEEFLVIMPETSPEAAQAAAQRLRRLLKDAPVDLPGGQGTITQTVSIGVAMGGGREAAARPEEVISRADRALLGAKSTGRNKVQMEMSAA